MKARELITSTVSVLIAVAIALVFGLGALELVFNLGRDAEGLIVLGFTVAVLFSGVKEFFFTLEQAGICGRPEGV